MMPFILEHFVNGLHFLLGYGESVLQSLYFIRRNVAGSQRNLSAGPIESAGWFGYGGDVFSSVTSILSPLIQNLSNDVLDDFSVA